MKEVEKKAKQNILKQIRQLAQESLKENLGGLKKITVASDSEEGLKAGLEKAEDILDDKEKFLQNLRTKKD